MISVKELVIKTWNHEHVVSTDQFSKTAKLVIGSLLGALAAIFQSAGIFAGIGYAFSILTTGPIVIATILSIRIGLLTFALTIWLLAIIQPSEVIVFPFTTGLLGISLGIGFRLYKNRILVTFLGGISLTIGILFLLYVFHFPILGPSVSSQVNIKMILIIAIFSHVYSSIWMMVSGKSMKYLNKVIFKRKSKEN